MPETDWRKDDKVEAEACVVCGVPRDRHLDDADNRVKTHDFKADGGTT
jgi:Zn ribbon nucleic-acid-binding protein